MDCFAREVVLNPGSKLHSLCLWFLIYTIQTNLKSTKKIKLIMKYWLLSFIMCLHMHLSIYCGAQPTGTGTDIDSFQVETLNNLLWVSTNDTSWNTHFIHTAGIDALESFAWIWGLGFCPIGMLLCIVHKCIIKCLLTNHIQPGNCSICMKQIKDKKRSNGVMYNSN